MNRPVCLAIPRRDLMETYSASRSAALIALALFASTAAAQGTARLEGRWDLPVGSEAERYARVAELAGLVPWRGWTLRPIAIDDSVGLGVSSSHPWADAWRGDRGGLAGGRRWLRPSGVVAANTAFPFEVIPGPAWAGRGLTVQASGGLLARYGRLRIELSPTVFVAQNAAFDLAPNNQTGSGALRDARYPSNIDAPQRMGRGRYARVDLGNSSLSLDAGGVAIGLSNAAQSWGPARDYPIVLSGQSGGFPHAFVATASPASIGIGTVAARLVAGAVPQSGFAAPTGLASRWGTGAVLAIAPKGAPGLELGIARFLTGLSTTGIPGPGDLLRVFHTELNVANDDVVEEDQLGSVFFRWAIPGSRLEVYSEYSRGDYAVQLRRFIQNPDHAAAYVVGLQRGWQSGAGRVRAVHFEVVNAEISSANRRERGVRTDSGYVLDRPRPPYTHSRQVYGHTNRGLFLGSAEAYGGSAWRLGLDDYAARGRTSFGLERRLRLDWLPGPTFVDLPHADVIYAARAEWMRFAGDRELSLTVIPMLNLNRNMEIGRDQFNLSVAFGVRGLR